jgi:hypothetical protein
VPDLLRQPCCLYPVVENPSVMFRYYDGKPNILIKLNRIHGMVPDLYCHYRSHFVYLVVETPLYVQVLPRETLYSDQAEQNLRLGAGTLLRHLRGSKPHLHAINVRIFEIFKK